jgi:hypothetical protein
LTPSPTERYALPIGSQRNDDGAAARPLNDLRRRAADSGGHPPLQGNRGRLLAGITGVFSILFGVVIAAEPAIGIVTLLVFIGIFALLYGVLQIALALRLRGLQSRVRNAAEGVR